MSKFRKSKSRQFRKERRDDRREINAYAKSFHQEKTRQEPEAKLSFNPKKLFNPPKIQAKSENQRRYIEAIERNDIVFGLGPAGCGKTFIAVAKAVEAFQNEEVKKLVFIRPNLGLGRSSGFLPGDLVAKMSPYVRPILDELRTFFSAEQIQKMIEQEDIEITALEYARGRTFKNAIVLLDEAQNATFDEMKAFLTRLGEGSKYIVTGDITKSESGSLEQSDLQRHEQGALEFYANRFYDLKGIDVVPMTIVDVVRHPLVKAMLSRGF